MLYIDRKYISLLSSQLKLFKQKSADLYSFRCPICGDSEKNKIKTRGYIFSSGNSLVYKCHNCGDSRSFSRLLEAVDVKLYEEYNTELFMSKGNKKNISDDVVVSAMPQFNQNTPEKILADFDRIVDLPEDHEAIQYLIKRDIPKEFWKKFFYTSNENRLESICEKYIGRVKGDISRLILPIVDQNNNMVGLSARAIGESKLRFITMKFTDDNEPMIFGLRDWDKTKYTYVTEGAFDSMFLPNALAVNGSALKKTYDLVDKYNTVFVFDNEPRGKEILKLMRAVIKNGFYICVWPPKINFKDINEMHLNGVLDIKRIIDTNTFRGLEAEVQLNDWSRV